MKNALWIVLFLISVVGFILGCGVVWIVLYNLFHGFGMNWFAGIAGAVVIGVCNALYETLVRE